jgi:hypothetical protein
MREPLVELLEGEGAEEANALGWLDETVRPFSGKS